MSVCKVCDNEYTRRHPHQQFCSRACYVEGAVVPKFEPTGKDFLDWAEEHRPEWIEEWKLGVVNPE